jgi:hypothetical protein
MKKHRLAKPKEIIGRTSRKPAVRLYEQYAELRRLRGEIRRLAASETKVERLNRS